MKMPANKTFDFTIFEKLETTYTITYFHNGSENYPFPLDLHSHTFYEINIITQGKGVQFQRERLGVKRGNVFILPPDITHGYCDATDDFNIFHLLISPSFLQRYHAELNAFPGYKMLFKTLSVIPHASLKDFAFYLNPKQMTEIEKIIDSLISLNQSKYKGKEVQRNALALYLIGRLCEYVYTPIKESVKTTVHSDSSSVLHSLEYIQKHYMEKLSIQKLSEIALMSRSSYLRHFKALCKCTPQDVITNTRINIAIQLLDSSNLSLTQIAQECGFSDSAHFTRVFHQKTGRLPSDYKKNKKSNVKAKNDPKQTLE